MTITPHFVPCGYCGETQPQPPACRGCAEPIPSHAELVALSNRAQKFAAGAAAQFQRLIDWDNPSQPPPVGPIPFSNAEIAVLCAVDAWNMVEADRPSTTADLWLLHVCVDRGLFLAGAHLFIASYRFGARHSAMDIQIGAEPAMRLPGLDPLYRMMVLDPVGFRIWRGLNGQPPLSPPGRERARQTLLRLLDATLPG